MLTDRLMRGRAAMKRLLYSMGILAVAVFTARADSAAVTITTLFGRTYHECQIIRVHPDGVSFTHSRGAAKVLFDDLPQGLRTRFGYDARKADAFEREIAERRRAETQARAERDRELAKALTVAHEMEVERLRTQRVQALGMQAIACNSGFGWPWMTPVAGFERFPPLGPFVDGRFFRRGARRDRLTWDSRGLVPLAPGTGGVVEFPSGGIQFFAPGMWSSPTLGRYVPGSPVPTAIRAGAVGRSGSTMLPLAP